MNVNSAGLPGAKRERTKFSLLNLATACFVVAWLAFACYALAYLISN
jgi:hypothetical protein